MRAHEEIEIRPAILLRLLVVRLAHQHSGSTCQIRQRSTRLASQLRGQRIIRTIASILYIVALRISVILKWIVIKHSLAYNVLRAEQPVEGVRRQVTLLPSDAAENQYITQSLGCNDRYLLEMW